MKHEAPSPKGNAYPLLCAICGKTHNHPVEAQDCFPTKEYGDVAGTTSLAQYFKRHALDHPDVRQARTEDSTLYLWMADGSEVVVHLVSNYKPPEEIEKPVMATRYSYEVACPYCGTGVEGPWLTRKPLPYYEECSACGKRFFLQPPERRSPRGA